MPNKLIIEFVNDWIRKKNVRCAVLHKEDTAMVAEQLDATQRTVLKSFDKALIWEEILKEMKTLGIDLDALRKAIWNLDPGVNPVGGLSTAVYDEGKTHIRRVEPAVISISAATPLVLLGQGFKEAAASITVECRKAGFPTKSFKASSVSCGVDVWQRVTVNVTLDQTGDWEIFAQNDDDPPVNGVRPWSDPSGTVHVV
jgi:hypothetical protein